MEGNDSMDGVCNGKETASVFELAGEPAIVINGVPNLESGYTGPIGSSSRRDEELVGDPFFGEWMEGRKVQKLFGDQYYSGKVANYDEEMNWYRVVYEDGDMEDLEWSELEEILLPIDISVPLTTLALRRGKSEVKMGKLKANHMKEVGSSKPLELMQESQVQSQDMSAYLMQKSENSLSMMQESCEKNYVGTLVVNETELKDERSAKESLSYEINMPESSKWQKEIKKQRGTTAKFEKQKRREKSGLQDHPRDA